MRIRTGFAAGFAALLLLSAYLGFADIKFKQDKALHFVTFLALTLVFYWVVDTSRKRCINMTLMVCTLVGGVGSEFVQSFLPYREFDSNDIICNVAGSLIGLAICAWYHKRLVERRRQARYRRLHGELSGDGGIGAGSSGPNNGGMGHGSNINTNIDIEAQMAGAAGENDEDNGSILLREVAPEPESHAHP